MITLVQPWFNSPIPDRANEYIQAVLHNINNPLIDRVILIAEHKPPFSGAEVVLTGKRATFREMIYAGQGEGILILANTDVYFDSTLGLCKDIKTKQCYAISRYDKMGDRLVPFHHRDSQDAWIFRQPVSVNIGDYSPGVPGCDNRIAKEILDSGYQVTNPCKSIHVIHLHQSGYRNYTREQTIKGEYYLPEPCYL